MTAALRVAGALALAAAPAGAGAQAVPPPVLDVHLHALHPDAQGPPPLGLCTPVTPQLDVAMADVTRPWGASFLAAQKDPPCDDPVWSATTDSAMMRRTLAVMRRRNVIGIASGSPELVRRWREAAPDRIIPGRRFMVGRDTLSPEGLRDLVERGEVAVLAEVTNQYAGVPSSDPAFEPYLAVAEALDLPVGIHVGPGPPGAPYLGFDRYRAALHSPLTLEEALVRHPRLRLYVMHAGWPMLDDMMAVMWAHPRVHVGLGVLVFALPRPELYRYLRTLVEAGFGRRIMFGSDQMVWPEALERGIEAIEEAPFLSEAQKRDILYDNAARFLRLDDATIARHHALTP